MYAALKKRILQDFQLSFHAFSKIPGCAGIMIQSPSVLILFWSRCFAFLDQAVGTALVIPNTLTFGIVDLGIISYVKTLSLFFPTQ